MDEERGKRIAVNKLGSFTTVKPGVLYRLWNNSHQKDLAEKLGVMMKEAYDAEDASGKLPTEFTFSLIPKTTWRHNILKLLGQDTQQFDKWKFRQQQFRRTLHVECDTKHARLVHYLCEKQRGRVSWSACGVNKCTTAWCAMTKHPGPTLNVS